MGAGVSDHESGARIAVAVVDDHRMFAESITRLLAEHADIEVVGSATSGTAALELLDRRAADVVLLDYVLPDLDGIAVATEIRRRSPTTRVVLVTGHSDDRTLMAAIDAGCSGYVTKDRTGDELVAAVRAAHAGDALISPDQLVRLLPLLGGRVSRPGHDLTARELDVLALLATGLANKAIAAELRLSVNTIRNHVQSILTKLGVHSKLEAVTVAVREGIVDYPARGPSSADPSR